MELRLGKPLVEISSFTSLSLPYTPEANNNLIEVILELGDTVDIFPAYADIAYRIHFWGDEIDALESF